MGSRAGLSFVQRRLEGRKEPKDYKRIDAACRSRHGDPSCSAPLLTGRASSPEQLDAEDGSNWGGSSKEKPRRGSQKSLGGSSSKLSNEWDNSWGDGWNSGSNSDTSPTKVPSSPATAPANMKGSRQFGSSKSSSSLQGKKKGAKEGLLIDFEEDKVGGGRDWNSKWDDDEAWEMLNKKD